MAPKQPNMTGLSRIDAEIICIGSVLWDVVGRAELSMGRGTDVGGRIVRIPGGVALNIALTLHRLGLKPLLLSAIGRDTDGETLIHACSELGLQTQYIHRMPDLPTDQYMAIEDQDGVVAAIADAHSLEAAGAATLEALWDGRLGTLDAPYPGRIVLDGNLTEALLAEIAQSPAFARATLYVAPASPGKAKRLAPLLTAPQATLYVNLQEAGLLAGASFRTAAEAGQALIERGARRVIVTDGAKGAADCRPDGTCEAAAPRANVVRLTGAGDTFMAGHIAAEVAGEGPEAALDAALRAAAAHVSGGEIT